MLELLQTPQLNLSDPAQQRHVESRGITLCKTKHFPGCFIPCSLFPQNDACAGVALNLGAHIYSLDFLLCFPKQEMFFTYRLNFFPVRMPLLNPPRILTPYPPLSTTLSPASTCLLSPKEPFLKMILLPLIPVFKQKCKDR